MTIEVDADGCMIFPEIKGWQVKEYRTRIGMSQRQFSERFNIPLDELKEMEGDSGGWFDIALDMVFGRRNKAKGG